MNITTRGYIPGTKVIEKKKEETLPKKSKPSKKIKKPVTIDEKAQMLIEEIEAEIKNEE